MPKSLIPFSFTFVEDLVPDFMILPEDIEGEIARYRRAIDRSREDLRRLQKQLEEEGIIEGVAILDAHQQIMHDPLLTTNIEENK